VAKVIEEAFQEATKQQGGRGAQLKFENPGATFTVTGDRAALKHALAEILLNALQASPQKSNIGVRLQPVAGGGAPALAIEVQDAGVGFSADGAKQATAPFYSQRDVGLGLGLTVSRKIIENHHGKLEIVPSPSGVVRVVLPLESREA
jgi:signal transduction histidine kinase